MGIIINMSSRATIMHIEILLPKMCLDITSLWEVENNYFVFLCFYM